MNSFQVLETQQEKNDRRLSGIITFVVFLLLFLVIFLYKFTKITETPSLVTTMLINFGDNRDGTGLNEPKPQEGSLASKSETVEAPKEVAQPKEMVQTKKEVSKNEIKKTITGTNKNTTTPKEITKTTSKKATTPTKNTTKSSAKNANSTTGNGDGQGRNAIGNIIRGRGTSGNSQGTGTNSTGNSGDPLGGTGNGDSKIGVDRKLIDFIPGTMGRGGKQPSHGCTVSGSITIAYTVDKAGNVITAKRAGGISDACVSSTSIAWVKKYVKAEKASTSSTGTYKITF